MATINDTRAMDISNYSEELYNLTSDYIPASLYHDKLMDIYMIPFVLVVINAFLGIIGNSVVLFIYISKMKKTKSRIFFITLAIFNFVNSAFDMPLEAYMLSHPLQYDNHWLCKMQKGVNFTINNVCACVFVAIAIDRLLLAFHPFKRSILTTRYAKIACVIAFVVGTATAWPGFVFYGTATQKERVGDIVVTGKMCFVSDYFLKNEKWPSLFNTVLFTLMIIVFFTLFIMYIIICWKMYDNSSNLYRHDSRRHSVANARESRGSTLTLALITGFFIMSFLPYCVIVYLRNNDKHFYLELNESNRIAYHVFLRFYFLNSVCSPLIYSFNRVFRKTLIQLIREVFSGVRSRLFPEKLSVSLSLVYIQDKSNNISKPNRTILQNEIGQSNTANL